MRVTFLGTSGAIPTTERNPSAIAVNREGDRLLFDCGEGTQRQMMRYGTGFDLDHVFLTHLHGDHVFGLPGLVQTFDFNDRERPLTVHAPAGTTDRVEKLLEAAGDPPSYPLDIRGVTDDGVVLDRAAYEVRAFAVDHRTRAVGYVIDEDDRKGRFDRETAEEDLGIPPGPKYSKLHAGQAIEHEGETIQPEAVVGPPRPGRRVVYTGDTRPTERTVEVARNADLLIHDGTFGEDHRERARETAHSTAREAAEVAAEADVARLALTHISTRYSGRAELLESQARAVFEAADVAYDGMRIDVPYPDADD